MSQLVNSQVCFCQKAIAISIDCTLKPPPCWLIFNNADPRTFPCLNTPLYPTVFFFIDLVCCSKTVFNIDVAGAFSFQISANSDIIKCKILRRRIITADDSCNDSSQRFKTSASFSMRSSKLTFKAGLMS